MRTRALFRRLDRVVTSLMAAAEALLDAVVTRYGHVYVAAAAVLISLVAAVFFAAVIPELAASKGFLHAGGHAALGLLLLGNVAFNYAQCVRTPPGNPEELSHEVLAAAAEGGRYCHTCGWPKPEMAHHCHICNRCVLKMDHHCPWMNTCIGANNYRYFLLTLVWMEVGAIYAAVMTIQRTLVAASAAGETWHEAPLPLLFVGILSLAMACALALLLGWHMYLTASCQSTIDFHGNWARAVEARRSGQRWQRPPHPTARQNVQDIFDVRGRWWYLTWLLPRWPRQQCTPKH